MRNLLIGPCAKFDDIIGDGGLHPALAGGLLLLSWLQHRRQPALVVWAGGFLTAAVAPD